MKKLTKEQFLRLDAWMREYARSYDRAKWNLLFHKGTKNDIVTELLKYQNADGGIGHGFESDVVYPFSAAIPTAEAIFQSYDYELDCNSSWFKAMLTYLENSVQDIPKYWEDYPQEANNYPHAPWWDFKKYMKFSPTPCAVIASAFICYGTEKQKNLGLKIAKECFDLLLSHEFCGDHDTLNIITLIEQLLSIRSPLITDEILCAAQRRISENVCLDEGQWNEYTFQPLDFVSSPDSVWYDTVSAEIEKNIGYWLENLNEQGVWDPNFSWGIDSEASRQATENWKGYIAVKRVKILRNFNAIEL